MIEKIWNWSFPKICSGKKWVLLKSNKKYDDKNKQAVIDKWNYLSDKVEDEFIPLWPILIAELIDAYVKGDGKS